MDIYRENNKCLRIFIIFLRFNDYFFISYEINHFQVSTDQSILTDWMWYSVFIKYLLYLWWILHNKLPQTWCFKHSVFLGHPFYRSGIWQWKLPGPSPQGLWQDVFWTFNLQRLCFQALVTTGRDCHQGSGTESLSSLLVFGWRPVSVLFYFIVFVLFFGYVSLYGLSSFFEVYE